MSFGIERSLSLCYTSNQAEREMSESTSTIRNEEKQSEIAVPDAAPSPKLLVRGPLKYLVETSTPQVEAGKQFSVSVRIVNPYDVPVIIRSVTTKLPAKFVTPSGSSKKGFLEEGEELFRQITHARSLRPLLGSSGGEVVQAMGQAGASDQDPEVELQPGNSTVKVFTVRTVNALFFVPSLYNLNIEVEYKIDEKTNHDTVAYEMNVRAPLGAIITGSAIGSIVGYLVRAGLDPTILIKVLTTHTPEETIRFWAGLVTAILIGGIVVVAFARKKDAQPILSIEDFWGGLFVGFLSAYGGEGLLKQVTGGGSG
jgi:hypothetical protein